MRRKLFTNGAFLVVLILVLWGCAGPKVQVEPIAVTENPGEQVSMLDTEIIAARKDQINVLAPSSFATAEENLNGAKDGLNRGDEISGILDNVAQGRAYLKRALDNAEVAKTALAKLIEARGDARTAGATIFEKDYAAAEKRFLELTGAIEDDNLKWAQKNQVRLVETFRILELRAIKEKTLGDVRQTIKWAEDEGAKKIAPDILAEVKKELAAVDTFITENPYKKEEMLRMAGSALFNAQRLVELTVQSKKLQTKKPFELTLWAEGMLAPITSKLVAPDMRNQPFETQVANIIGTIGTLQADRQFMADKVKKQQNEIEGLKNDYRTETVDLKGRYEDEVRTLNAKIAELEGITKEEQAAKQLLEEEKLAAEARLAAEKQAAEQRLAAERRFNQLYNEVQAFFGEDEAEVYKQGNKLVIRLKGIHFPVGQAIIMPANYGLLSKVQRAVRTFDEPVVVIEGHTDSTGSAATNEHLSEQRAKAVQEYLVANQTLPASKTTAIGYGSIRPLASNATPEGRAVNRRIDIVITPESTLL